MSNKNGHDGHCVMEVIFMYHVCFLAASIADHLYQSERVFLTSGMPFLQHQFFFPT